MYLAEMPRLRAREALINRTIIDVALGQLMDINAAVGHVPSAKRRDLHRERVRIIRSWEQQSLRQQQSSAPDQRSREEVIAAIEAMGIKVKWNASRDDRDSST